MRQLNLSNLYWKLCPDVQPLKDQGGGTKTTGVTCGDGSGNSSSAAVNRNFPPKLLSTADEVIE
jgi:hypothetical protein